MRSCLRSAYFAAAICGAAFAAGSAVGANSDSIGADGQRPAPALCGVPAAFLRTPFTLAHMVEKLRRRQAVRIVAIGSSSTYGTGASGPAASYPSRLGAALEALFPHVDVTVINHGVPGDTSTGMIARFKRDAIDPRPDLIIWQTGTNMALGGRDIERFTDDIRQGIVMARTAGIDLLLMGPQFAPRFESVPNRLSYVQHLYAIATVKEVPLFPRYQIMKYWLESGQFTLGTMINADGLHLTDGAYACLGRLVARMIADMETGRAQAAR